MSSNTARDLAHQALMQLESDILDLSGWTRCFGLVYSEANQASPDERPREDWQKGCLMSALSLLDDSLCNLLEALEKDHAALHEAFCAMKQNPPTPPTGKGLHIVGDAS